MLGTAKSCEVGRGVGQIERDDFSAREVDVPRPDVARFDSEDDVGEPAQRGSEEEEREEER